MGEEVNLYAIQADWSPEVYFMLTEDENDALRHGVFVAARDLLSGDGCPTASVYLVGEVTQVGTAKATDASPDWRWAAGVHASVAEYDRLMAELRDEDGRKKEEG